MRKPVAQKIKRLILKECERQKVSFHQVFYRRAKKGYAEVPWNQKHLVGR